ncbi:hypothetical protein [Streptomyces sp. DSM 40484]|uniref:hypothetical protein n=1 Tax=Streptomyces kroppenstedtii TaxID=3051181 RepID=UPI0028D3D089|nr:hypothetical protein [Streptomyces sp. DSM 40484]
MQRGVDLLDLHHRGQRDALHLGALGRLAARGIPPAVVRGQPVRPLGLRRARAATALMPAPPGPPI